MVLLLTITMEEDAARAIVLVILLVKLSPIEEVMVTLVIVKNSTRVDDAVLLVLAIEDNREMASVMMLEDVVWEKDTVGSNSIDEASRVPLLMLLVAAGTRNVVSIVALVMADEVRN